MCKKGAGTLYRIVVRSELSDRYAVAFEGMEMEAKDGRTILTGEIIDEPHLHGILDRIGDLGLELLSVHALGEEVHPSAEEERELQRDRPHDRCSVGHMADVASLPQSRAAQVTNRAATLRKGRGCYESWPFSALLLGLIHPTSQKGYSTKFAREGV
jgi:hypothetical protein